MDLESFSEFKYGDRIEFEVLVPNEDIAKKYLGYYSEIVTPFKDGEQFLEYGISAEEKIVWDLNISEIEFITKIIKL